MSGQLARVLLRVVAVALLVGLFFQLFAAGMAAMTDPYWWSYHVAAIKYTQWLVVLLPFLAWFCGRERRGRRLILSLCPTAQIGLQYVFAHRALDGRLPIGLGLHAVNAGLLLLVAAAMATGVLDPEHRSIDGAT